MMNLVNVKALYTGLVYKNNRLVNVITEGKHYVLWGSSVEMYDMTLPFYPSQNINIVLQNELVKSMIELVNVAEDQLGLRYVDNKLMEVLTSGQYAYWKNVINQKIQIVSIKDYQIKDEVPIEVLESKLMDRYVRKMRVESYQFGLLYVNQVYQGILKVGVYYFWQNPTHITLLYADTRILNLEINGQEILTRDKATIRLNFSARYKIVNCEKAMNDIKDYEKQLYILVQMSIRDLLATLSLDELLNKKAEIGQDILKVNEEVFSEMGLKILDAGIKDIILPGDMKDIMNQVLMAEKKAQANMIMRREETSATRSMLNTAKLMEENQMLWKLKEMEYVERITDKIQYINLNSQGNTLQQLKELFTK